MGAAVRPATAIYARSLGGSRLASTSIGEIRRIRPDRHPGPCSTDGPGSWESFPDVKGDGLVAVFLPGQGAEAVHP